MITERKLFNILSIIEGASFTISIIFGILIVIKFTSSIYPETNKNIYPLNFNLFDNSSTSKPIILGTWPGINSGSCLHNSELSINSCSFSDLNCENVDAVDPINITIVKKYQYNITIHLLYKYFLITIIVLTKMINVKVILLGNSFTGKSSFINRLVYDTFSEFVEEEKIAETTYDIGNLQYLTHSVKSDIEL